MKRAPAVPREVLRRADARIKCPACECLDLTIFQARAYTVIVCHVCEAPTVQRGHATDQARLALAEKALGRPSKWAAEMEHVA